MGWTCSKRRVRSRPRLPVLAVTAVEDVETLNRACALGCFLLHKAGPATHLLDAVADFARRETRNKRLLHHAATEYAREMRLTPRQAEILYGYFRGADRDELADMFGIAESTLSSHINAILRGRFVSLEMLRLHVLASLDRQLDQANAPEGR